MYKKLWCFILVWNFFSQEFSFSESFRLTKQWFRVPNPLLGYIKPYCMLDVGRTEKLYKFIKTQLSGNKRD